MITYNYKIVWDGVNSAIVKTKAEVDNVLIYFLYDTAKKKLVSLMQNEIYNLRQAQAGIKRLTAKDIY